MSLAKFKIVDIQIDDDRADGFSVVFIRRLIYLDGDCSAYRGRFYVYHPHHKNLASRRIRQLESAMMRAYSWYERVVPNIILEVQNEK